VNLIGILLAAYSNRENNQQQKEAMFFHHVYKTPSELNGFYVNKGLEATKAAAKTPSGLFDSRCRAPPGRTRAHQSL
jgi:hypothetical protein